tara:strand:- start:723 stop:1442 length:720 start_codon:yes stop_codon:yes gene_type:complete
MRNYQHDTENYVKRLHNEVREAKAKLKNENENVTFGILNLEGMAKDVLKDAEDLLNLNIDSLKSKFPTSLMINLTKDPNLGFLEFESFKLERGDYTSETHNIVLEFTPSSPIGLPNNELEINTCELNRIILYSEDEMKSFHANEINRVVELDEEKTRSFLGIAGKAAAGLAAGLIFAPLAIIGAAAGAMSKKRNIRVIIFGIEFNSGEKIVCSIEAQKKEFIQFKSSMNKLGIYNSLTF